MLVSARVLSKLTCRLGLAGGSGFDDGHRAAQSINCRRLDQFMFPAVSLAGGPWPSRLIMSKSSAANDVLVRIYRRRRLPPEIYGRVLTCMVCYKPSVDVELICLVSRPRWYSCYPPGLFYAWGLLFERFPCPRLFTLNRHVRRKSHHPHFDIRDEVSAWLCTQCPCGECTCLFPPCSTTLPSPC